MQKCFSLIETLPGLVLVAPMAVAALAIFKWGVSRHDAQFARQREFLQNWKDPEHLDDLSIEVLVRQLTGSYLPAALVRRVCRRERTEVVRTLIDLAVIWPLVEWDACTGRATWKRIAKSPRIRRLKEFVLWLAYLTAGILGGSALVAVALQKPDPIIGFAATAWGVILVSFAGIALWKTDAWGTANKCGDVLLRSVNSDELPSISNFPAKTQSESI